MIYLILCTGKEATPDKIRWTPEWLERCAAPCLCSYSGFSTSHPAPVPKALSQNSDIYFVNRWKKRHDKKKCAHIVHRTNINIFNTYSERTVRSLKHNSQMFEWTLMPKNSCDDTKDVLIQFINIFFFLLLCSWLNRSLCSRLPFRWNGCTMLGIYLNSVD